MALTVLVAYLPTIPGSAFKFMGFPLLLGGLLVGPRTGFAMGCLTDLINFALHPSGPFFLGFTLTQGLTGGLPGLLTWKRDILKTGVLQVKGSPAAVVEPHWTDGNQSRLDPLVVYLKLLGIFALTKLLTSVLLVSYFTSKLMGTPLQLELASRAAIQAVHVPIYALLALLVLQSLARTDLYHRLMKARR